MEKILKFLTGHSHVQKVDYKTLFSKSFVKRNEIIYFDNLPIPFMWTRVLFFLVILGIISYLNSLYVGAYAFAWLTLVISSVIPITISVFLYEMIKVKKVDFLGSIIIFVIGITLSFFLVGQISVQTNNEYLDTAVVAPIIEELAKFLTVYIMIKYLKVKKISYAVFIGFVVGAGFQVAETMGYATFWGLYDFFRFENLGFDVLFTRSLYGFNSHGLWSALHGIGIILSIKNNNIKYMFKWSLIGTVLHFLWNSVAVLVTNNLLSNVLLISLQLLFVPIMMLIIMISIHDAKEIIEVNEEEFIS